MPYLALVAILVGGVTGLAQNGGGKKRSFCLACSDCIARSLAFAADRSALAARSSSLAISDSASSWARLADLAMNRPIATSEKTPIVTRTFPVTLRRGHAWLMAADHASGPDSSSNPMTTKSPAKSVATSSPSRPKPILMSLLIGPFMGRRRYSRGGKNGPLIAVILAVVFACLLGLLIVMTFDFSLASVPARADRHYEENFPWPHAPTRLSESWEPQGRGA